jgi:cytochrome c oxidase subunit 2
MAALMAALLMAAALAAGAPEGESQGAVDDPASPVAQKISDLFWIITWIAVGVGAGVQIALLLAIIKSRKREREEGEDGGKPHGDEHEVPDDGQPREGVFRPRHYGSTRLEVVLFVITLCAFLTIGGVSWMTLNEIEQPPEGATVDIVVEVTGHQWFWEFHYPQAAYNITSVGKLAELHAPRGAVVQLKITATDVLHAVWIPDLGVKIDAIPGTVNTFWFRGDKAGTYLLQCAEYCGGAHSDMHAVVIIEERAQFDAWVAAMQEAARPPPAVATVASGQFNITLEQAGPVPGLLDITDGANVSFLVTNHLSAPSALAFSGPYAGTTMSPVAPGGTGWLNITFSTPHKNGTFSCGGCAAAGAFNTSQGARIVDIALTQDPGSHGIWSIQPEEVHAQPGEVLQFRIRNTGTTTHNFTVGTFGVEILFAAEGIGGNTTLFPGESMLSQKFEVPDHSADYWCDVPGHYGAPFGMRGKLIVEGGSAPPPVSVPEETVPGFGAACVPLAVVAAAALVARRRRA